jgi:hypothetical protein
VSLKGKGLQAPMLGAQRRVEARIGQLLGAPEIGSNQHSNGAVPCVEQLKRTDRNRFRLLARGFDVLRDEEWRQSRSSLLKYLRDKFPVPKYYPPVTVTKSGQVRKSKDQRVFHADSFTAASFAFSACGMNL